MSDSTADIEKTSTNVGPTIAGLVFAPALAISAWKKPNGCRIFLGFFYMAMAIVNIAVSVINPRSYVKYGENSYLPFYKWLVVNIFAKAPALFVRIIAAYQLALGLLILKKGKSVKLGLAGSILFIVGITPLSKGQISWLGVAFVQGYLLTKDFDETLVEIVRSARLRAGHRESRVLVNRDASNSGG